MIKKTKKGYAMDKILLETVTEYSLVKSEQLELRIDHDNFIRRLCGNCGKFERPDIYSIQAFSPVGAKENLCIWICDECAEKFVPELYDEMIKKRAKIEREIEKETKAEMKEQPKQQENNSEVPF